MLAICNVALNLVVVQGASYSWVVGRDVVTESRGITASY
jgi:hypothetical protein